MMPENGRKRSLSYICSPATVMNMAGIYTQSSSKSVVFSKAKLHVWAGTRLRRPVQNLLSLLPCSEFYYREPWRLPY